MNLSVDRVEVSSLHDTYSFQALEQSLYILSEYFRGAVPSFQADTELELKLENKGFFFVFWTVHFQ